MRLSDERIKSLQVLLKNVCGLEYNNEQAHEAGMAIIRFVLAKAHREKELASDKEK